MSNYRTKINFKNKTVEIRAYANNAVGGSKLFEFPIDERKDIIQQLQEIDQMLEFLAENPDLANIREIDPGMAKFLRKVLSTQEKLLATLEVNSTDGVPSDKFENDVHELKAASTDIEILLHLHAPESSLARGSVTSTANTPHATGEA